MIELQDLRFAYAEGGFELQIDQLSVAAGQRVCWVGPSGSGKTTLLHLVAGIFPPAAGKVTTCGVELTAQTEDARRDFRIANVGLVFQDFALLDYLSVIDNILLPYRLSRALVMTPDDRTRAKQLADSVGLGDKLSRLPTQLSQGERQRVATCRALIAQPQLVLADEPTANLDSVNSACVMSALESYTAKAGAALVVVSHDQEVIARFDQVTHLADFCLAAKPAGKGGSVDA